MSSNRDEGPVYYREIQKNAFLKRIPNEINTSKLRPLGHKKPPLKPMWTLFCVHNGRTPFLEQYPEPDSATTLTHRPAWRVCLRTARHVTASVKPHVGDEYDFLIDTDQGPVRMLAPDWDSMQDWVTTLRNKLHELKILAKGENVYCAAPIAPVPRAAARDPTSPLPPTPPVPPDRVPGIELTTQATRPSDAVNGPVPTPQSPSESPETNPVPSQEQVDISNWDDLATSQPSTSQAEPKKSVTKICGQNICLDDSILKRTAEVTESDEEFFSEIDRIHESAESLCASEKESVGYTQRVVVSNGDSGSSGNTTDNSHSLPQRTNITVIQVSNKGPPHTAIPVLGPETDVFDFNFQQNVTITPDTGQGDPRSFVNIVNTEMNVHNTNENDYGTVFAKSGSEYGHLSLTTTVSLTGEAVKVTDDSIYERLCMASTSGTERAASPLPVKKIKSIDKIRKSSLPNLELTSESTYECLFPNSSQNNNLRNTTNVTLNHSRSDTAPCIPNGRSEINSNVSETPRTNVQINVTNATTVTTNLSSNTRAIRSNVDRSHSQNAYDSPPRLRENLIRRVQNNSPKREVRVEKNEAPAKPIWKRGLTELSLLSRLRGLGQGKRQESPTRHENDSGNRSVTSPVKVVHRSRPQGRVDSSRRRSSSLSNGHSPGRQMSNVTPNVPIMAPLRARQAATLRAEQRRGAAVATALSVRDPPIFADYERQVWVARWGVNGARCGGRSGDRVAALAGAQPTNAAHARLLLKSSHTPLVDILFHRVPLGKIYVISKRDRESTGIKLDGECVVTSVAGGSSAARAGLPPPGRWALTEVNNRAIDLLKGGEEEMNRLSMHGSEVSILIQPAALVKKLRAAIKSNKSILSIR